MKNKLFIEVVLPVPLANSYTYSVPQALEREIKIGTLVLVEFGKNKHYSGLVSHIHHIEIQRKFEIKDIIATESAKSVLRRPQLRFWEWLCEYYMCKMGEVYKAVFPVGFRSQSASSYKVKTETFVRLCSPYNEDPKQLEEAFASLKKALKQETLLLSFLHCCINPSEKQKTKEIAKTKLLIQSKQNIAALNGLINKNILELFDKEVSRLDAYDQELKDLNKLNEFQQKAYSEIIHAFREKNVCLLHGLTSSGKTEIYIYLIQETLKLGKQALFLLPEIALTTQITKRLKSFFGNKVGVYHSKISNNERVEIWNNLLEDDGYQIILGVRSSIFLPYKNLGLIIVDEEHETSYKQQDPAPRYHARNAAIILAQMHGAKTLLGSATPSMESFYNAQNGKYAYVLLNKRYEDVQLPLITAVDIKELKRKKQMKSLFSPLLLEKIETCLQGKEQIILFQNRRGFAPITYCKVCEWVPKCEFCDVSLTYHKKKDSLRCHYCGTSYPTPTCCPSCGHEDLKPKGFGTEKVEEEINKIFPQVKLARLDTDTAKNKDTYDSILSDFESGKTQILIGTQMLSKGLDFDNVSLVGILNADSMMNFPDFRAHERAFQLMVQVAGRSGRRKTRGEVILQTAQLTHPLIQMILNHDYIGMYNVQIEERLLFKYPPFFRLIEITFKHRKEDTVDMLAKEFAYILRQSLGTRLLGPDKPPVAKIQNFFLQRVLLKLEASISLLSLKAILEDAQKKMEIHQQFKYLTIQYDVDPM